MSTRSLLLFFCSLLLSVGFSTSFIPCQNSQIGSVTLTTSSTQFVSVPFSSGSSSPPFDSPPVVFATLSAFSCKQGSSCAVSIDGLLATTTGFTFYLQIWDSTLFNSATISWVALPSEVTAYVGYQNIADSSASSPLNSGSGTREAVSSIYLSSGTLPSPSVAVAPTTFDLPNAPTSFLVTSVYSSTVSDFFNVSASVFDLSSALWVGASWLAVDAGILQNQGFTFLNGETGFVLASNLSIGTGPRADDNTIFFSTGFGGTPKVIVWLNGIGADVSGDLEVSVTVNNVTSFGFVATVSTTSSIQIQNFSIAWIAVLESAPNMDCPSSVSSFTKSCTSNILPNGDFELGLSSWSGSGFVSGTSNPSANTGAYYAIATISGASITQSIDLSPYNTWIAQQQAYLGASFWLSASENSQSSQLQTSITVLDISGASLASYLFAPSNAPVNSWGQQNSLDVALPLGASSLNVTLTCTNPSGGYCGGFWDSICVSVKQLTQKYYQTPCKGNGLIPGDFDVPLSFTNWGGDIPNYDSLLNVPLTPVSGIGALGSVVSVPTSIWIDVDLTAYKGYIANNAASLRLKFWLASQSSSDIIGVGVTLKDDALNSTSTNTLSSVTADNSFGWGYAQQEFIVALYPDATTANIQLSCTPTTSSPCQALFDSVCLDISAPSSLVTFVTPPSTCALACQPGNVAGNCAELQDAIELTYPASGVVSIADGSYNVTKNITIAGKQVILETSPLGFYEPKIGIAGGLEACLADSYCATTLINSNPVSIICDQFSTGCSSVSEDNSLYCFILHDGGDVSLLSSGITFQKGNFYLDGDATLHQQESTATFQGITLKNNATLISLKSLTTVNGVLSSSDTAVLSMELFSVLQTTAAGSLQMGDQSQLKVLADSLAFLALDSSLHNSASISIQSASVVLGDDYLSASTTSKNFVMNDQSSLDLQASSVAIGQVNLNLRGYSQLSASGSSIFGASRSGLAKSITLNDFSQLLLQGSTTVGVSDNLVVAFMDYSSFSAISSIVEIGQTSLAPSVLQTTAPTLNFIQELIGGASAVSSGLLVFMQNSNGTISGSYLNITEGAVSVEDTASLSIISSPTTIMDGNFTSAGQSITVVDASQFDINALGVLTVKESATADWINGALVQINSFGQATLADTSVTRVDTSATAMATGVQAVLTVQDSASILVSSAQLTSQSNGDIQFLNSAIGDFSSTAKFAVKASGSAQTKQNSQLRFSGTNTAWQVSDGSVDTYHSSQVTLSANSRLSLNNALSRFTLHDYSNVTLLSSAQITMTAGAATAQDNSAILSTNGGISVTNTGTLLKMTDTSRLIGSATSVTVGSQGTLSLELQSSSTFGQGSTVQIAATGGSIDFKDTSSSRFQTGSILQANAGLIQLDGSSSVAAIGTGASVVAAQSGTIKTLLNSKLDVSYGATLKLTSATASLVADGSSKVTVDGSTAQVAGSVTVTTGATFQAQNLTTLNINGTTASMKVGVNANVAVTGSTTLNMNGGATFTAQDSSNFNISANSIANIDSTSKITVKDTAKFTIQNSKATILSGAGTGGIEARGNSSTTVTTSSFVMVSGGRLDVLENALFQILQSSIVCVNGGIFSATSAVPIVIDSSSQLLLAGGNVGLTSDASLTVNNAVLWLASGTVSFSTGAILQLTASELQILGGQLIITGTARFILEGGSKVQIMSGELDFSGTTKPIVQSGSEIDIGDFVPLASNPLCPFTGTPLPGPGVVKVDGSSELTVQQDSAVTVRNGTFNVTANAKATFIDARLDVYQVGLVVAELSSTVSLQHSNFSVSESGNVLIQGNAKAQLGSQSRLDVSGSGSVTFTGNSISNVTTGSAVDVTGGVVSVLQNAIVGMTSSTASVSTAGTLNVDAQGELDIFATSALTVGAGGNVDVIGSGSVNVDSSTVGVNAGTVYIGAQGHVLTTNGQWSVTSNGLITMNGTASTLTFASNTNAIITSGSLTTSQNAHVGVSTSSTLETQTTSATISSTGTSQISVSGNSNLLTDQGSSIQLSGSANLDIQSSQWTISNSATFNAYQTSTLTTSNTAHITLSSSGTLDLHNTASATTANTNIDITSGHLGANDNSNVVIGSSSVATITGGSLITQASSTLTVNAGSTVYALAGGGSFDMAGSSKNYFTGSSYLICDGGIVSQGGSSLLDFTLNSYFIGRNGCGYSATGSSTFAVDSSTVQINGSTVSLTGSSKLNITNSPTTISSSDLSFDSTAGFSLTSQTLTLTNTPVVLQNNATFSVNTATFNLNSSSLSSYDFGGISLSGSTVDLTGSSIALQDQSTLTSTQTALVLQGSSITGVGSPVTNFVDSSLHLQSSSVSYSGGGSMIFSSSSAVTVDSSSINTNGNVDLAFTGSTLTLNSGSIGLQSTSRITFEESAFVITGGDFIANDTSYVGLLANSVLCMSGGTFTAVVSASVYVDPTANIVINGGQFTVLNGIGLSIINRVVPIISGVFAFPQGSLVVYSNSKVLIVGGLLELRSNSILQMRNDSYVLVSAGGARFYDNSTLALYNSTLELNAGNYTGLLQPSILFCLSNNTVSNITASGTGFVEFLNNATYESYGSSLIITQGRWLSSQDSKFRAYDSKITIQGGDIKFETGASLQASNCIFNVKKGALNLAEARAVLDSASIAVQGGVFSVNATASLNLTVGSNVLVTGGRAMYLQSSLSQMNRGIYLLNNGGVEARDQAVLSFIETKFQLEKGDFAFFAQASLSAFNATVGVLGGSMIYNEMSNGSIIYSSILIYSGSFLTNDLSSFYSTSGYVLVQGGTLGTSGLSTLTIDTSLFDIVNGNLSVGGNSTISIEKSSLTLSGGAAYLVSSGRLAARNGTVCQFNDGDFVASDYSSFIVDKSFLNVNGSGALITGSASFRCTSSGYISILKNNLQIRGNSNGLVDLASAIYILSGDLMIGDMAELSLETASLYVSNGNLKMSEKCYFAANNSQIQVQSGIGGVLVDNSSVATLVTSVLNVTGSITVQSSAGFNLDKSTVCVSQGSIDALSSFPMTSSTSEVYIQSGNFNIYNALASDTLIVIRGGSLSTFQVVLFDPVKIYIAGGFFYVTASSDTSVSDSDITVTTGGLITNTKGSLTVKSTHLLLGGDLQSVPVSGICGGLNDLSSASTGYIESTDESTLVAKKSQVDIFQGEFRSKGSSNVDLSNSQVTIQGGNLFSQESSTFEISDSSDVSIVDGSAISLGQSTLSIDSSDLTVVGGSLIAKESSNLKANNADINVKIGTLILQDSSKTNMKKTDITIKPQVTKDTNTYVLFAGNSTFEFDFSSISIINGTLNVTDFSYTNSLNSSITIDDGNFTANANCSFNMAGATVKINDGGIFVYGSANVSFTNSSQVNVNGGNVTISENGSLKVVSNSLMNITGGFVYVRDGGQIVLDDKSLCDNGKNIQMDSGRFYVPPDSNLNVNSKGTLQVNSGSRFYGLGVVNNEGSMIVQAQDGTITFDVSVQNTASVLFDGGDVTVKEYIQTGSDAVTELLDITIQAGDSFSINGGLIQGSGTIDGSVVIGSEGTVATQTLNTGTFDNSGTWQVQINSDSDLTIINVKSTATINRGSVIQVRLPEKFKEGDSYVIMNFKSIKGQFEVVTFVDAKGKPIKNGSNKHKRSLESEEDESQVECAGGPSLEYGGSTLAVLFAGGCGGNGDGNILGYNLLVILSGSFVGGAIVISVIIMFAYWVHRRRRSKKLNQSLTQLSRASSSTMSLHHQPSMSSMSSMSSMPTPR